MHCGVSQTLNSIRAKLWIPQGRSAVKKVLGKCSVCKKAEGGPYRMPDMASLPSSRVLESAPFTNTGLDNLGPLHYYKNGELKKACVCLFTCRVTRAIHLEMVLNMTTDAFFNCFRHFIACRGTPKQVICDNASHFKLACDVRLKHLVFFVTHTGSTDTTRNSTTFKKESRNMCTRTIKNVYEYESLIGTIVLHID